MSTEDIVFTVHCVAKGSGRFDVSGIRYCSGPLEQLLADSLKASGMRAEAGDIVEQDICIYEYHAVA